MENYEELSLNIRTAFRLLAYYNKCILNLMNHIKEKLTFTPVYDLSHFYEPILNKKDNLSKRDSTMSWLPMYFHEFHFEDSNYQFSVFIQSDSGSWKISLEWDEIDKYDDLKTSKTRFLFAISNSPEWDSGEDLFGDENFDKFLQDEFVITKKNKKIIVCKSFELSDFKDEKTTDDTLKKYIDYVKSKGINSIDFKNDDTV